MHNKIGVLYRYICMVCICKHAYIRSYRLDDVEAFITKTETLHTHASHLNKLVSFCKLTVVVEYYSVVHTRIRKKFRFQNQYPNERRGEHTREYEFELTLFSFKLKKKIYLNLLTEIETKSFVLVFFLINFLHRKFIEIQKKIEQN